MKGTIFCLLALSLTQAPLIAFCQDPSPAPDLTRGQIEPPGRIELAKHQQQLDPPIPPQAPRLDTAKLRQEADELSSLAQSVPADIAKVSQGKLPKDMAEKLKRIEKLSKHLRGELTP
jgi:hypothetical protein